MDRLNYMTAGYYNFNYDSRLESLEWQYHISALSGPGLHSASFILVLLNYPKKREPEPPFKGKYYLFSFRFYNHFKNYIIVIFIFMSIRFQ
jgi:hypothetical protein